MDFLPRPYIPNRTAYRPLISAGNRRINMDDDTFLQQNPVCGIFLPPLAYGTDRTPDGLTIAAANFASAVITIYSKQELILDNVPLPSLVPTANAQQIPYLFTKPIVIDFTRSFVLDNTIAGDAWGGVDRVIPIQYFYLPAAEFAEWDLKRRIEEERYKAMGKQLGLIA